MDFTHKLAISYYKTVATINAEHNIYLVQHQESQKIYVKKILDVYNIAIYTNLLKKPIKGTPRIIDFYEEDNKLTVIEEYVSGISLTELIKSHTLSESDIQSYMRDICAIMEELHNYNPAIIHRDIKPSNIIITSYNRAILLDFNAAKYYSAASTEDTVLLGTQGYAAPEQYGFGSSSPQTDIYSLGIVQKEMLLSAGISSAKYDAIIKKCTSISPSERYQTVAELKDLFPAGADKEASKASRKLTLKDFVVPGFRTKKLWKMVVAIPTYLMVLDVCLSLELKNSSLADLWMQRIICLITGFLCIFASFNYMNMQNLMPLCKSNSKSIRLLGIAILDVAIVFIMMIILVAIESIFF